MNMKLNEQERIRMISAKQVTAEEWAYWRTQPNGAVLASNRLNELDAINSKASSHE